MCLSACQHTHTHTHTHKHTLTHTYTHTHTHTHKEYRHTQHALKSRIAKQQAKQHEPKRHTGKLTPQDMQSKPKVKKGYYAVEKILDHT